MRLNSALLHLLVISSVILGCTTEPKSPIRKSASTIDFPAPEQGETWTPENEAQATDIVVMTENIVRERDKTGIAHRDAHPKHHGCAKATFRIDAQQLPPGLQVGVFAANGKKEYPAWIRFSNGDPKGSEKNDLDKDVRGMAVKLLNIPGTPKGNQDFLMCTAPEFFAKDGEDYLELFKGITGSTSSLLWYMAFHGTNRSRILASQVKMASPLEQDYHSATIYKLGPTSMRFSVTPCATDSAIPKDNSDPNYLKKKLVDTLGQQSACFNFYVQPNMQPQKNLMEDPRLKWDEAASPKIKVATIEIPQQTGIDSKEQLNFCENISFDPWNSQAEIRPMGQINRTRKLVYNAVSEFRHRQNRIPNLEPKNFQPCQGETSVLCDDPRP